MTPRRGRLTDRVASREASRLDENPVNIYPFIEAEKGWRPQLPADV
jgi:hypothetical protein